MSTEFVQHSHNQAENVAEFYAQNEALNDPTTRRSYFENLTADDFTDLLQQVNSMVRGGDSSYRQTFDGQNVALARHEVPDYRDKEQLLKDTWESAQLFLKDTALNDEDALAYAGLTVAGGILYTHPFADSNGRSSRVMSHMIMEGAHDDITGQLTDILGKNGRVAWYNTPPVNAMNHYTNYNFTEKVANWTGNIDWQNPEDGKSDFVDDVEADIEDSLSVITSSSMRVKALHHFMANVDPNGADIMTKHTDFDHVGNVIEIHAVDALRELTALPDQGIKYMAQLLEAQRWVRADHIHRFLTAMHDQYPITPAGNLVSLTEDYRNLPEPNRMIRAHIAAYGKYVVGNVITPADHFRLMHEASSEIVRKRDGFVDQSKAS